MIVHGNIAHYLLNFFCLFLPFSTEKVTYTMASLKRKLAQTNSLDFHGFSWDTVKKVCEDFKGLLKRNKKIHIFDIPFIKEGYLVRQAYTMSNSCVFSRFIAKRYRQLGCIHYIS